MCGIGGIVRLDGGPVEPAALDALTDAVSHRGPDARGTVIRGHVGLGHRRLSILDLTAAGAQPMLSENGDVALTFNGEIYNFMELRRDLEARGRTFRSHCDTEVLLALYEAEGPACVRKLRGMFSFAVHDQKRNILFCARDRMGKKPLLYFRHGNTFAFASELKALRTLRDCPRTPDREALHHYLTLMYLPAPLTGFDGIEKLPAAHTLTVDLSKGDIRIERYWELDYTTNRERSVGEWKERIAATFDESVKLRMVADVPVGAFLSGGVDSASVVAAMSRHSPHPVRTFSIGSDDPRISELPLAALVAKRFGTQHTPIDLRADIVHLLPELVRTYEMPYADPSAIPTYLIAQASRKDVTVVLNGDGGDENFGGYLRYPITLFSRKWERAPGFIHGGMRLTTDLFHMLKNDTFSYRARRFEHSMHLPWEQRYLQYISFFTEEEKRAIERPGFTDGFPRTDAWFAKRTSAARARAHDTLHQAMSMDMDTYLPDDLMPKVDLGTMAHGLEARSPFLDHELLELTAALPAELQVRGRATKTLWKDMMRGVVPDEILAGKKRGFRLPLDKWFRGDLRPWVEAQLMEGHPLFWEMFDRAKVETFLQTYWNSRVNYSDHVWALLWLREWMVQYV